MLTNCHLAQLVHKQAATYGKRTALSFRDYARERWIPVSWEQFSKTVAAVSRALLSLGVRIQENVAVFSQNMPECLYVDFGAYGIRAVTIPFYATSSGAQVKYMITDAEIRYLFVGEQLQYDTAFSVMTLCPSLERIIIFDPSVKKHANDSLAIYFDEFLALGEDPTLQNEVDSRTEGASMDDIINILYTSGTTGDSKGVILTAEMYHEAFRVNDKVLPISDKDVLLNFLPFTHVFERAWSYLGLAEGAQLAINLKPNDVLRSLQEVHPTCMSAVPRFWEKVYQGVLDKMEHGAVLERKMITAALRTGKSYAHYKSQGITPPFSLSMKYKFFERTVIELLKRMLGLERGNFFPTAGAAVSPVVEEFVHAAGINMIVGYGLTESTATVSCDVMGLPYHIGSVGRVIEGLEVRIGEQNEILLRGKTITPGYYKRETATKTAIDADGWFHTGDAGYLREGELYLTDRIKDLFKTSNGKYIAPQLIETKLIVDRYIDQAVIVADEYKFVSALIVPNFQFLEHKAEEEGFACENREALCEHPRVLQFYTDRINTLQQDLAHYEKIKRFTLLPAPFTLERGELTNTLKIRRKVVYEHYAEAIEKMYREAEGESESTFVTDGVAADVTDTVNLSAFRTEPDNQPEQKNSSNE